MSELSKLRRPGSSPFPTVRKSPDPFQPEMGEMDFSEDMAEYENTVASTVQETENTEQNTQEMQIRRERHRLRQHRKKNKKEEVEPTPPEENLIDIRA